jgi:Malectin domain
MPRQPDAQFAEAERAELQHVVEALARWPRLSGLLCYMGEKFFSGQLDQLNEYNIATEVLGRSKKVFDPAEDAIARVETHRLRKRLAVYYETEGKDHPIQVTLPAGLYVPAFIHKPEASSPPATSVLSRTPESASSSQGTRRSIWTARGWKYAALAASLVLAAFGAYLFLRAQASSMRPKPGADPVAASASVPPRSEVASLPVRLLAGYSGPPRTDSAGRVWNPDRDFSGGGVWQRAWQWTPGSIARTSDSFLFEHSRTGDFSYSIPLKPGSYELHLLFSTPIRANENISTFNVWMSGKYLLPGFDINSDALGDNIADERVYRDVSPDKDGFLRIVFSSAMGPPTLNALEILPGLPHKQLPIRLIMQTTPFVDHRGQFWQPDNYFMNGRLSPQTHPLLDSPDPELFAGERYGHFTYAIPVDTRGSYTLLLHFAEFYFGSGASGNGGVGNRIFKVMCNGETLLDKFDILKEVQSLHEVTKTFRHLKPSAQGKLNLTFEPIVNNATISGIEVLDESQ